MKLKNLILQVTILFTYTIVKAQGSCGDIPIGRAIAPWHICSTDFGFIPHDTTWAFAVCDAFQPLLPCGQAEDILYSWYMITCYSPGTLNLRILPRKPNDDYNWALYDVTGRRFDELYSDSSLLLACNWSIQPG